MPISKPWYESKRAQGILTALVGLGVQVAGEVFGAEISVEQTANLTDIMSQLMIGVGSLWAWYGSLKAEGPITMSKEQRPIKQQIVEPEDGVLSSLNMAVFFDNIRSSLFNGSLTQDQVDGCNLLLTTCKRIGLNPFSKQAAYVLATAYHETGRTMMPVREAFGKSDEQTIARLDKAWSSGKLPWVSAPYWKPDASGKAWFGRGYVQLTHEENYERQQYKLESNPLRTSDTPYRVHDYPELALNKDTAVLICGQGMKNGDFTGKKLDNYITNSKCDFHNARRIVNGTESASKIAAYAQKFMLAIDRAQGANV